MRRETDDHTIRLASRGKQTPTGSRTCRADARLNPVCDAHADTPWSTESLCDQGRRACSSDRLLGEMLPKSDCKAHARRKERPPPLAHRRQTRVKRRRGRRISRTHRHNGVRALTDATKAKQSEREGERHGGGRRRWEHGEASDTRGHPRYHTHRRTHSVLHRGNARSSPRARPGFNQHNRTDRRSTLPRSSNDCPRAQCTAGRVARSLGFAPA